MYYKFLNSDGRSTYANAKWHLPTDTKPGRWMPRISAPLVVCETGYHLCRPQDLPHWIAPVLYEAEADEASLIGDHNKIVTSRARLLRRLDGWNERTQRLFAVDCAERALDRFESKYPYATGELS